MVVFRFALHIAYGLFVAVVIFVAYLALLGNDLLIED